MEDPDETCPECPLFRTKPGREPQYVTHALAYAMMMERRQKAGFRINDPNMLKPLQWAAVEGLQMGRSKWEEQCLAKERENKGS
jgi:hypothetical protein